MIPFDVKVGGQRVAISFESLFWFFIVTAGATVLGELVYDKWVSPYLADFPNLPSNWLPGGPNDPTVVSVQGSSSAAAPGAGASLGRVTRLRPAPRGRRD